MAIFQFLESRGYVRSTRQLAAPFGEFMLEALGRKARLRARGGPNT